MTHKVTKCEVRWMKEESEKAEDHLHKLGALNLLWSVLRCVVCCVLCVVCCVLCVVCCVLCVVCCVLCCGLCVVCCGVSG